MKQTHKAQFTKLDVVREYLREFPNTPKKMLARMLVRDHPLLWTNVETARQAVNSATGKGNTRIANPELFRDGKFGDAFPELPKGLVHFEDWAAVKFHEESRWLILPDLHIPFHSRRALKLAIDYGVTYHPTHVLLNGDFVDFFSVSFWEKDPRKRDLKHELEIAKQVLTYIRRTFTDAKIILKVGNHEERWDRYLCVKSPELYGIEKFMLPSILELDKFDVQLIGDMRPIKLGEIYVVHGHEFKWGVSNPVNPARGFYLRAKENCLGSHLHQSSSHAEKSIAEEVVSCWSTGCLCDLHPDYAPLNKWNHGFATIDLESSGYFQLHNFKILEGRIFEG